MRLSFRLLCGMAVFVPLLAPDSWPQDTHSDRRPRSEDATAYWTCPQSRSPHLGADPHAMPFSAAAHYTIRYDASTAPYYHVDIAPLRDFLARAAGSRTDYTPCAESFILSVQRRIHGLCMEINWNPSTTSHDTASTWCSQSIDIAMDPFDELLAGIHRRAEERPSLPTVIPFDSMASEPNFRAVLDGFRTEFGNRLAASQCPQINDARAPILLSSEFIRDELPGYVSRLGPECRTRFLSQLADRARQAVSQAHFCRTRDDGSEPLCFHMRSRVASFLREIARHQTGGADSIASRYVSGMEACVLEDHGTDTLTKALQGFMERQRCVVLDVGESMNVESSDTGITARYRLSRPSGSVYRAEINPRFLPEAEHDAYVSRTRRCLAQANRYLRSPDGQRLDIVISTEADVPVHTIDLTPAGTRSHSHGWASDVGCPTIVHETLHLLGLADEYQETVSGYTMTEDGTFMFHRAGGTIDAYSCRLIGPRDSMMNDPTRAWQQAVAGRAPSLIYPAHFRAITTPRCPDINGRYYKCARLAYRTRELRGCELDPGPSPRRDESCYR